MIKDIILIDNRERDRAVEAEAKTPNICGPGIVLGCFNRNIAEVKKITVITDRVAISIFSEGVDELTEQTNIFY